MAYKIVRTVIEKIGVRDFLGGVLSALGMISLLGVAPASAQVPHLFLFDHPIHETWYKKALDACMQSWGDLRAVIATQEDSATERADTSGAADQVVGDAQGNSRHDLMMIDAAVGRLHFADFCLKNLCAQPTDVADDDVLYLWRIMQEFNPVCAQLEQDCCYKDRAECVRAAAQQVRDRLAKYTYTVDEAFFYKATSTPQPNS